MRGAVVVLLAGLALVGAASAEPVQVHAGARCQLVLLDVEGGVTAYADPADPYATYVRPTAAHRNHLLDPGPAACEL